MNMNRRTIGPESADEPERSATMERRTFLAAAAAIAGLATRAYGQNASAPPEPVRYPDPRIVVLDKRFGRYKLANAAVQRLFTGTLWAEGPAWSAVGRYLLWSDIP